MKEEDKPAFLRFIAQMLKSHNQPNNDFALQSWMHACKNHNLDDVRQAVLQWCSNPDTGKWPPKPADIAGMLQKSAAASESKTPRIAGNEAWAVAFEAFDEANTVVWTDEMAHAFDCARPLLQQGDKIGARMAFLDAYARIVAANLKAGIAARVLVSRGWDGELYRKALQRPLAQFLLAQDAKMREALMLEAAAQPEKEKTDMPQWFADWLRESKKKWARQEEEAQAQKHAQLLRQRQDWQGRKKTAQRMAEAAAQRPPQESAA